MNIRVLAATVAGGITMTLLGWLLFGMLLANYFKNNTHNYPNLEKIPPDWIPLILFHLAFAWLTAFVFDYWATIKTFLGGIRGGFLIALPIAVGVTLQQVAFVNVYRNYFAMLVNIVIATIIGTIGGGVTGLVLGAMDKKTE